MQQIADWLEQLGMSEYAQRFAENGIGFAALRHLTDQDLKDIGVLLGHRRIILAAIQELGSPVAAQPAPVELKPQDTEPPRRIRCGIGCARRSYQNARERRIPIEHAQHLVAAAIRYFEQHTVNTGFPVGREYRLVCRCVEHRD
jgi:hypothetical protein